MIHFSQIGMISIPGYMSLGQNSLSQPIYIGNTQLSLTPQNTISRNLESLNFLPTHIFPNLHKYEIMSQILLNFST